MKKKGFYDLKFSGLKDGIHDFQYELEDAFFKTFEEFNINGGKGKLNVVLDKKANLLSLDLQFDAGLDTNCDRCGDDLTLHINGEDNVYVKFDNDQLKNDDESIVLLAVDAYQIPLDNIIFELIVTKLPLKKVHESEDDCNQEAIEALYEISSDDQEEEVDDRWNDLKELLNKKIE